MPITPISTMTQPVHETTVLDVAQSTDVNTKKLEAQKKAFADFQKSRDQSKRFIGNVFKYSPYGITRRLLLDVMMKGAGKHISVDDKVKLINHMYDKFVKTANDHTHFLNSLVDSGLYKTRDSLRSVISRAMKKGTLSDKASKLYSKFQGIVKKTSDEITETRIIIDYDKFVDQIKQLKEVDPSGLNYDKAYHALFKPGKRFVKDSGKTYFKNPKIKKVKNPKTGELVDKPQGKFATWKDKLKEEYPELYTYMDKIANPPKTTTKDLEKIIRSGGVQTPLMKKLTGKIKDPKTGELVDKPGTLLAKEVFPHTLDWKAGLQKAHPLQKIHRKKLVEKYGDKVIDPKTGKLIPELKQPSFMTSQTRNEVIHRALENDLMDNLATRENLINAYKKGDMTLAKFKPLINVNKNRINKIKKRMTNLGLETKTYDPYKGRVVSYGAPPVSISRLYSHPRFGFKKLGYNEGGIASISHLTRPI